MITKKIAISLMSIATALAMTGGATYAFFTDTATSSANTFGSGKLDISLAQGDTGFIPFNVTNLKPGSRVSECAGVSNDGTLDFNWHFSLIQVTPTPESANLNDVLKAKIETWTGASAPTESDCNNETNTNVDNWADTALFDGFVSEASNPDKMGTIPAGQKRYFRITAYLPNDLVKADNTDVNDNDYQNGSASYQFKVDAYQIGDPTY